MESGRLPFLRVGKGHRKVRPEDLYALIESVGIPSHKLDPALWSRVASVARKPASAKVHALLLLDVAGTILFWNPEAVERFGWTSSELEGKAVSDLPARVPGLPINLDDLAIPASGETFRTLLLEIQTKSGVWLATEVTVSWAHDNKGGTCGTIFVLEAPQQKVMTLPKRGRKPKVRA